MLKQFKFVSVLIIFGLLIGACSTPALPAATSEAVPTMSAATTDLAPSLEALATTLAPTLAAAAGGQTPGPEAIATEAGPTPVAITAPATLPAAAISGKTIQYEDISITVPEAIASDARIEEIEEHVVGEDAYPELSYPEHYEVSFEGYQHAPSFHEARIYIWEIEDYLALDKVNAELISKRVNELKELLAHSSIPIPEKYTKAFGGSLPFLPPWNAGAAFSAQVTRFPFQNGDGIRYLTMYGQAYKPVNNFELFYSYQGLSADHKYYISAVLPIASPVLQDTDAYPPDADKFAREYQPYLEGELAKLNAEAAEAFRPSLALLDAMMASLRVD